MIEKVRSYLKHMPRKRRVMLIVSIVLTLLLCIEIPVLAWFSNQRKMAVLASVNAPYTLYLSAGNQEDLVYLDMSSIDVGTPSVREKGTHKDFVFSVQGSWDISEYYLQVAHTTNIPFEYTLYRVKDNGAADRDIYTDTQYHADDFDSSLKETSVAYTAHMDNGDVTRDETIYYTYRPGATYSYSDAQAQFGKVMDKANYVNPPNGSLGIKSDSNSYYDKTYGPGITAKVQKHAVPLYMQAGPIKKNAGAENGKDFCDYYILRVDWENAPSLKNDKETDMVYITVVSPSVVYNTH